MITDKTLKYAEILFTIWVVLLALVGITIAIGGNVNNIPSTAWFFLSVTVLCAYILHLIRKERRKRDLEEFFKRHPILRGYYH